MDMAVDGTDVRVPFYIRWFAPLLKNRMLNKPMRPGFQLPKQVVDKIVPSGDVDSQDALQHLERAVERLKTEEHREPHLALGRLTRQQWDLLHCRHAELHFSFVLLGDASSD